MKRRSAAFKKPMTQTAVEQNIISRKLKASTFKSDRQVQVQMFSKEADMCKYKFSQKKPMTQTAVGQHIGSASTVQLTRLQLEQVQVQIYTKEANDTDCGRATYCIRTLPRGGMYWVLHPRRP